MFDLTRRDNSRSLDAFNPFREMEDFGRSFFSNPFNSFFGMKDLAEFKMDVTDEGDHYLLQADLPGFKKKDIELDIDNDVLTIRAERRSSVEEKDRKNKVVRMERSYGSYSRQFDVSGIDSDKITARYEDGVLKLRLPKREKALPNARKLEIE